MNQRDSEACGAKCGGGRTAWLAVLGLALVGGAIAVAAVMADEPKADEEKPADAAKGESAQDILKQIMELANRPPTGNSRDEVITHLKTTQREVQSLAEKLLAHPDAAGEKGEPLAVETIRIQMAFLGLLTRFGEADPAAIKALLDKHANDTRPKVARLIAGAALAQRFTPAHDANVAAIKAIAADAKQHFATVKPLTVEHAKVVMKLGVALERREASAEAADLFKTFGEMFSKSDDPEVAGAGRKLVGSGRRLGLIGQPMEVYGTLLDGKAIDWASYRGKVVLVDFWATWCGPCVMEVPNIVRNYERYHDRGFEVIGVSVDDDRKPVDEFIAKRKIPWTISMDSDFKASGKTESLAEFYGVTGIPTAILVDREGKVVSLEARGPELGRLLATLIGPEEKKKPAEKKEEKK